MSTARADLRVKNSSPAPAAQREHEPARASEEFLLAVPDYSKLTILSQPQIRRARRPAAPNGVARRQRIHYIARAPYFFYLLCQSNKTKLMLHVTNTSPLFHCLLVLFGRVLYVLSFFIYTRRCLYVFFPKGKGGLCM